MLSRKVQEDPGRSMKVQVRLDLDLHAVQEDPGKSRKINEGPGESLKVQVSLDLCLHAVQEGFQFKKVQPCNGGQPTLLKIEERSAWNWTGGASANQHTP